MTDDEMERAAVSWLTARGYTVTKAVPGEIVVEQAQEFVPYSFDGFWAKYPRKVGKAAARKAFGKADPKAAVHGLVDWLEASAFNTNPEYILHASTWLNQKCYLDIPVPYKGIQKPTQGPNRTRKALDDWLNDEGI